MIRARCQKSIRRAARARIFASESWTRQYKKARGGWQYLLLMALAVVFLPVFAVFGLIGIPAMGGIAIARGDEGVSEIVGVLVALLSAIVAVGHASWLVRELLSSKSLAVASQLPLSDQQYLSNRLRYSLRATLAFLGVALAFFVAAAFAFHADVAECAMIIALAPFQWAMVTAFSLIIPAWFPRVARTETVGGLITLGILAVVTSVTLAQMNLVQIESIRLIVLTVFPTGWAFLLLEFAIFRHEPIVACLLLPAGLSMLAGFAAIRRLRSQYQPWEVTLDSDSFAQVAFAPPVDPEAEDDGRPSEWLKPGEDLQSELPTDWRERSRHMFREWVGLAAEREEVELSPGDAADRVRRREFLEPYSWPQGGLVERMVGTILTDREQRVAELIAGSRPEWSRRMLMDMVLGCIGLAALAVAQQFLGNKILMLSWHIGIFVLFAGMRRSWPGMAFRCSTGHIASIMGLLPMAHHELNRVVMVLGTVRALLYAPFALAVCATGVAGMNGGIDWLQAVFLASKIVLIVVSVHQWWFIGLQPHQSTRPVLSQIVEGLFFVPLLILGVGGAGGMIAAGPSELLSMAGAATMFGAGWRAQRWQRKRVLSDPIDFITVRPADMQQQQQAQQRRSPTSSW